jgi:hypothetical protein
MKHRRIASDTSALHGHLGWHPQKQNTSLTANFGSDVKQSSSLQWVIFLKYGINFSVPQGLVEVVFKGQTFGKLHFIVIFVACLVGIIIFSLDFLYVTNLASDISRLT